MKYKLVKVTEKNGKESYTIKKRNFFGIWKPKTYAFLTDYGPVELMMHGLTLEKANEIIKNLTDGKLREETIKEFKI